MQPVKSQLEIIEKKQVSHDCYIYSFKWAGPKLKFAIAQHLRTIATLPTAEHPEGEQLIRKYTPISPCSQEQPIDILVKIYRPNVLPQFPNGGKYTPHLQKMNVGEKIDIEGPCGRLNWYTPGGNVKINEQQSVRKRLFLIAGGSGITPCYHTIKEIMNMPGEETELILLYANKTQDDILLRKELEELQPRLKLYFILDVAPAEWKGFTGYVNQQILESLCPLDDPNTLYCHCGPKGMNMMIMELFAQKFPNSTLIRFY